MFSGPPQARTEATAADAKLCQRPKHTCLRADQRVPVSFHGGAIRTDGGANAGDSDAGAAAATQPQGQPAVPP